jgi:hypothetical protein
MKSSISSWIELGLVLLGLFVCLGVAWRRSSNEDRANLPAWRRRTLRFGLIGTTVSLGFCLVDLGRLQLIMRGIVGYKPGGWLDTCGLTALLLLIVASTACAAFGRGAARLLTVISGALLGIIWFLLFLSTIP